MRGIFRYGERRLVLKRDLMHADAADQIAMAAKSTSLRDPVPAWRFVLMAAFPTAGTRSPFRSAEARNAGVFTLLVEVLDVLAILPLGHPLVKHIPVRPLGALFDRGLLPVPAPVPHLRRFHLPDLQ
jgi:hypothetical protein